MMLMRPIGMKSKVLSGTVAGIVTGIGLIAAVAMPVSADLVQIAAIGEKPPDRERGDPEV